ncbi:hypothetical protein C8R43DRAFT_975122 [Mycena crocata]|nr:hypothetical protein C8R43DRAFT_975122 [Mycena crocata]
MAVPAPVFMQVPVIDFTAVENLDDAQCRVLVDEIRRASENVGFFYVKNHGIPDAAIAHALNGAKQLFALPYEDKMQMYMVHPESDRGYRPPRGFNIDPSKDGDLVESMIVEWEPKDGPRKSVNKWPVGVPDFRSASLEFYDHGRKLASQLYQALALAMGESRDFFANKTQKNLSVLRFLHYPEVAEESNGTGAHAEYVVFTILWQQPAVKGLQVLTPANKWIDVPPVPGHLIVNLGDQMSRLTNGVFRSAQHRVVSHPGSERYSIPMFFFADFDATLEPVPRFVSAAQPVHYEAVYAGDQLGKLSMHAGAHGLGMIREH